MGGFATLVMRFLETFNKALPAYFWLHSRAGRHWPVWKGRTPLVAYSWHHPPTSRAPSAHAWANNLKLKNFKNCENLKFRDVSGSPFYFFIYFFWNLFFSRNFALSENGVQSAGVNRETWKHTDNIRQCTLVQIFGSWKILKFCNV